MSKKGYVNSNKKILNRSEKFLFCYKGMDHEEVIGNIRSLTHNAESQKTLENFEKRGI